MIKTLKTMSKQDKERYTVPRKVQDVIPVRRIWQDGIFLTGNKFSKTYQFSDINYLVASREDKESMFLIYSELLNSLDSGAVTKITINNRRTNKANFENSILMPMQEDFRDEYRREYNQMLLDKATGANGITQEKYITISVVKKDIEEARAYFSRVGADLVSHFAALGSKCVELDASERLRILHDFYRQGEEAEFQFNAREMAKRGHDFKDYICPNSMEKNSDYVKLGDKFCRVLFLKDYASYIKDNMVTELTDFNRNLMFSIDVVPVPTDEAVREVENRLLGVETNITNWQRRQNANNNFSAVVPYDMELQRKESKEFLDDLTTRDQRMMFAVITLAITADTKEQLDSDTEAVLSVARKHMCQLAVLKFQQLDGLNTALPIGVRKINAFRTLTTESLAVFIGEAGSTLSGGEKQRISIARAILKDAPIIILDEATSSVDPENEKALLDAIFELTKNKTLISIAHRLSTVRTADQIVVIDQGHIVQHGTHEELAKKEGVYRTFLECREKSISWKL